MVEQSIEKAKEYIEAMFEDFEQAQSIPIAVEEIEEMLGTSEITEEREWTEIVLKIKKKPNAEIKLDKLKDMFMQL